MKCKVCGKNFRLKKENRYEVFEPVIGLFSQSKLTECFDCPHCGCQNALNSRIPSKRVNTDEKPE